jgi:hypothetical protein
MIDNSALTYDPIKTQPGGVIFGQNVIPLRLDRLDVGMEIEVSTQADR